MAGDSFVPGSLLDLVVEQVLGDGRVAARDGVGQVDDQGEMQWVGAGGQCLVKYPVAADAISSGSKAFGAGSRSVQGRRGPRKSSPLVGIRL